MRNGLFRFLAAVMVMYSFGITTMAQTVAFDTEPNGPVGRRL